MNIVAILETMAWMAFYILVISACLGVSVCIYLGVRKAALRTIDEERGPR